MATTTPNPFARDSDGLLSAIHHPRRPDGRIDWRAMVSPQFLYVNPDYEDELKTRFNVKSRRDIDPTKVPDNQLLIMLGGWEELLRLRGYKSHKYPILISRDGAVSVTCEIEFLGNFETDGHHVTHSAAAGANLHSVSGKFQLHLEAMASNAAFARCVRTFLNVPIYGKDEFDSDANKQFENKLKNGENPLIAPKIEATSQQDMSTDPHGWLRGKCLNRKKAITFEALKTRACEIKEGWVTDPQTWKGFGKDEGIGPRDIWTLGNMIDKADQSKAR